MTSDAHPTSEEDRASRPPIALPEGTRLREEYEVGDVLGAGSFGVTYRARDVHLDTTVAIKEYYPRQMAGRTEEDRKIRPLTAESTDEFEFGLEQFMQEGRTVARFDHPNIVDVRSYFEENGTGYLVMDYYEGQTLAEYLSSNGGTLSEGEALALIEDVLSGLRPVHEAGVLHRDIDPHNVYRTTDGTAVLIDFGAAREAMGSRSQDLSVILKPGYAPFEQYSSNGAQGPHTDIYACAATLYKCLTGMKPPEATDRVHEDELVSPREVRAGISMETSIAVRKGLAVDPERRPSSVEEFSSLLGGTRTFERKDASTTEGKADSTPQERVQAAHSPSDVETETGKTLTKSDLEGGRPEGEAGSDNGMLETSAHNAIGVLLGVSGIVGATLLVSEAGPVEILSFFGTWIAVCFGLVGLFREGEKVMSGESRAAVSDWLLREDFSERKSNWPKTFVTLFDALFTEKHLSWTCFRRSALTSVLVITMLFGAFVGFGLITLPTTLGDFAEILVLLGIPIMMNVFIDYMSLFETRWILGRMATSENPFVHAGYLGIDLVLTALCIILPVSILQIFGLGVMTEFSMWSSAFWYQLFSALVNMMELFLTITVEGLGEIPRVMSVMLYSTMFTSVWVWLYVLAGLVLRLFRPVFESLDLLKRHLNVETRPVHAMGMLLAVLVSVGFAVSAPFVL